MDRIFTVSDNELNDSEAAHYAYINLLSVMLYPEDLSKQRDWLDGISCNLLPVIQEDLPEDDKFWATYGKKSTELASKSDYLMGVLEAPMESRKTGLLGASIVRGSIAGQILWHLVKPSCGTLRGAYKEITDRFESNLDDASPLAIPSESSLKKIWEEYKNVSHFWAAEFCFRENGWGDYLYFGPLYPSMIDPEAAKYFVRFLGIASFFRQKLLELQNPSTQKPLITLEACDLVWQVIKEDGKYVPPLELSLP